LFDILLRIDRPHSVPVSCACKPDSPGHSLLSTSYAESSEDSSNFISVF
jgi:hypothetical protein